MRGPKLYGYVIRFFQNVNEFKDWYMDLNAIVKHNNLVTCNCCISHNKQHKMKEIRLACNSEACYNTGQACDFKYKVLHCSKQHDKFYLSTWRTCRCSCCQRKKTWNLKLCEKYD
jgi:hypothetical protein